MEADPTDSVRELLEQAESPMSTGQIAQALSGRHGEREVAESLDFWRREHHAVVQDDKGDWTWQGPGLD
ncbi:MAG TPA: hypothetical protein VKG38_09685 [Solirubrobacteraceae bacterium]|nr:hypothetical protein [Solirubrobacteraceae bacterium]